jgi:hypothetical protein
VKKSAMPATRSSSPAGASGIKSSVRANPGVKSDNDVAFGFVGKDRVERSEDSVACTEEVAFSNPASS